jgi:hypothetical protein
MHELGSKLCLRWAFTARMDPAGMGKSGCVMQHGWGGLDASAAVLTAVHPAGRTDPHPDGQRNSHNSRAGETEA